MHIHHPRLLIDNPTKLLFINFRCNCARSVFGQCKIELKHCITEVRFPVPLNEANKGSMNHIVWQQNRPFARSGQMVMNKLCWDANNAVKLPKQRNSYQSSPTFISFGKFHCAIPAFRTMWPARAKGLFWQVAEKQFQFLTLRNKWHHIRTEGTKRDVQTLGWPKNLRIWLQYQLLHQLW